MDWSDVRRIAPSFVDENPYSGKTLPVKPLDAYEINYQNQKMREYLSKFRSHPNWLLWERIPIEGRFYAYNDNGKRFLAVKKPLRCDSKGMMDNAFMLEGHLANHYILVSPKYLSAH